MPCHLPATAAGLATRQMYRTQPGTILTHPTAQGPAQESNDPGDPAAWGDSHQEQPQPSDNSQREASLSKGTDLCSLEPMVALGRDHPGMGHQAGKPHPAPGASLLSQVLFQPQGLGKGHHPRQGVLHPIWLWVPNPS